MKQTKEYGEGKETPLSLSKKDKKKIPLPVILILILLLIGIAVILYPIVSNVIHEINRSEIKTDYEAQVKDMEETEIEQMYRLSREYNESLLSANIVLTDPFDPSRLEDAGAAPYPDLLNVQGDGIMGYIEIPLIDVELPIYHGTSEATLQKGVGHLEQTSLPIGGTGTHTVLTGHTGLAGEKLFTDLPELKKGDVFYLHILDNVLAYSVEHIEIVEPENTELLKINRDRDMVTLITCYPYGINSHRLLVQGERTEYDAAKKQEASMNRKVDSIWEKQYKRAIIICIAIYVPLTVLLLILIRRKKGHKKGKEEEDSDHPENNLVTEGNKNEGNEG